MTKEEYVKIYEKQMAGEKLSGDEISKLLEFNYQTAVAEQNNAKELKSYTDNLKAYNANNAAIVEQNKNTVVELQGQAQTLKELKEELAKQASDLKTHEKEEQVQLGNLTISPQVGTFYLLLATIAIICCGYIWHQIFVSHV